MEKAILSPFQFNNIPNDYDPWFEMDECRFTDLLSSVFGEENTIDKKDEPIETEPDTFTDERIDHDFYPGVMPQEIEGNPTSVFNNKPYSVSLASWEILNNYGSGLKMPREEVNDPRKRIFNEGVHELSTEEILRVAGERFVQFSTNRVDGISMFINPYGPSLSGLSIDQARDVELVHVLLTAADNVGRQQFDVASEKISRCFRMASDSGSPIQRIAFYFSEALQEKIRREFGRISYENEAQPEIEKRLALGTNNTFLSTHQKLPFTQVMQFAGIQAIIENVKTSGKIHLIDLQIRSGIQWAALMQGLSDYSIQHLKITAVGTVDQKFIEETGKRLLSFASSLNLPFSFEAVYLNEMRDFEKDLLKIEPDETVAFYSYLMLRSMLSKPDCLENLMREITKCNPALMVVTEVEANTNCPSFVGRFIEALFYYSAVFDCLEDCLERDDQCRIMLEAAYSYQGILNILAAEDKERITRDVKIEVWRAFLERFGMTEIELSQSSSYQASLVLKQFEKGSSCTLDYNGKSLIVGWKGTPVHSLTIWKFS